MSSITTFAGVGPVCSERHFLPFHCSVPYHREADSYRLHFQLHVLWGILEVGRQGKKKSGCFFLTLFALGSYSGSGSSSSVGPSFTGQT